MKENGAIAPIVILIILAIGIVVGTNLVQVPQIFKPKAAEPPECTQDDFPMIQDACASCISEQRPGLIDAISKMRVINCNVPKMISLWCNGNPSQVEHKDQKGNVIGYTDGVSSYNTSVAATDACIRVMSAECYQQCRDTVLNHTIGSCKAVAHGFPAQPLEPNTRYEFQIEQTEMEGVPDFPNHVGIRRDGIVQEAHASGPGFRYRVILDSGGPGTHVLQMAYNDTALYQKETGVDPNDPKQIMRFNYLSKDDFAKLKKEEIEALSKKVPTSVIDTPAYRARVVCLDLPYQVKSPPTPTPVPTPAPTSTAAPTVILSGSNSGTRNQPLAFTANTTIGSGKSLKSASIYVAKRLGSGSTIYPGRVSRTSCPLGFICQNDRNSNYSDNCAWCRIGNTTSSGQFTGNWTPTSTGEYDVMAVVEDSSFQQGDSSGHGLCASNPYASPYPYTDGYGKFNYCGLNSALRVTIR